MSSWMFLNVWKHNGWCTFIFWCNCGWNYLDFWKMDTFQDSRIFFWKNFSFFVRIKSWPPLPFFLQVLGNYTFTWRVEEFLWSIFGAFLGFCILFEFPEVLFPHSHQGALLGSVGSVPGEEHTCVQMCVLTPQLCGWLNLLVVSCCLTVELFHLFSHSPGLQAKYPLCFNFIL